ncbi:MAG: hypothetical protein GXP29_03390 [Planctomycetes bacterium]|nr:hypothetical protein [Planctomycetota bacterium]
MTIASNQRSASGTTALAVRARIVGDPNSLITLSRLLWLTLLVLHGLAIPGLIASISSGSDASGGVGLLLRIAGLSASAAFFVLKIIDVPWLRMNGSRRSIVSIILILVLMHVGAIDRAISVDVAPDYAYIGVVAVAGATRWRIAINRAFCRVMLRVFPKHLPSNDPPNGRFDAGFGWTWADEIIARLSQTFLPSFSGPRAPPTTM